MEPQSSPLHKRSQQGRARRAFAGPAEGGLPVDLLPNEFPFGPLCPLFHVLLAPRALLAGSSQGTGGTSSAAPNAGGAEGDGGTLPKTSLSPGWVSKQTLPVTPQRDAASGDGLISHLLISSLWLHSRLAPAEKQHQLLFSSSSRRGKPEPQGCCVFVVWGRSDDDSPPPCKQPAPVHPRNKQRGGEQAGKGTVPAARLQVTAWGSPKGAAQQRHPAS